MIRADLHIHTYYSDGLLSPAEVVAEAKANGVELISVTDHDCMTAYPEVLSLCGAAGLQTVSGVEVSAYDNGVKIHILGYGADGESPAFKAFLNELYVGAQRRAEDIIFKLRKNGINVTAEEIDKFRKSGTPVHTMHIARACAAKGYGDAFAFYANYLAPSKRAFSCAGRPTPEQAVQAIIAGGGKSSLAHPGRIALPREDVKKLTERLAACGLYGIEAVYTTHTANETAYFKETAKAFNLVVTGGSDTHLPDGKHKIGAPEFRLDEAVARRLKIEK